MDAQQQFRASLTTLLDKITLLSKSQLETQLKGFKPAEVHTIEFIGKHQDVNVTKIADAMFVTRGAVSKLTKRLMARELIERYQKPDNKKEIYFRLTPQGRGVFLTHEQLDKEFQQRDQPVFDQTDPVQLQTVLAFLDRYNQHLDHEIEQHHLQ